MAFVISTCSTSVASILVSTPSTPSLALRTVVIVFKIIIAFSINIVLFWPEVVHRCTRCYYPAMYKMCSHGYTVITPTLVVVCCSFMMVGVFEMVILRSMML